MKNLMAHITNTTIYVAMIKCAKKPKQCLKAKSKSLNIIISINYNAP